MLKKVRDFSFLLLYLAKELFVQGTRSKVAVEETLYECKGSVHKVGEVSNELSVDLLLEILPRECEVRVLGPVVEHVETPDIGGDPSLLDIVSKDAYPLAL